MPVKELPTRIHTSCYNTALMKVKGVTSAWSYSLNKKEWICSLFKEWILEKSEIRVNLEWIFVLFTHFGVTTGSLRDSEWSLRSLQNEWITQNNVHSKFTLISLFSNMHSLKSEHIHSFLFREYDTLNGDRVPPSPLSSKYREGCGNTPSADQLPLFRITSPISTLYYGPLMIFIACNSRNCIAW